jgi:hypothetical protein
MADDVGAPVAPGEERGRPAWRISFGRFALTEQDAPVKTWTSSEIWYRDQHLHLQNVCPATSAAFHRIVL